MTPRTRPGLDRRLETVVGRIAHRHRLTERQREILLMLCEGLDTAAMQARLGLSQRTVRHHTDHLLVRLSPAAGSRSLSAIVGLVLREALGPLDTETCKAL